MSEDSLPDPVVNPNSLRAFEILEQFLEEDDWHPQRIEERYVFRSGFSGKNGEFRCFAQIIPDAEQFLFYAVAPMHAPEELRASVSEFITRANYGMRIGNFELDYSDGEVRYKTSLDFEGELLNPNLIRHMIYPAVLMMDRYLPGLMSVMFGGRTPFEAIDEIEGGETAE